MLIQKSVKKYLKKLSSGAPTPGGGSASALAAALGTALILMVARIVRKKSPKKERVRLDRAIRSLNKVMRDAEQVVDLDVKVYRALIESYRAERSVKQSALARRRIETALNNSFRLQADLAMLVLLAKENMGVVHRAARGSIANDLVVARGFLDAAFRGALATAKINLAYMKSQKKEHFRSGLDQLEKRYYGIKT